MKLKVGEYYILNDLTYWGVAKILEVSDTTFEAEMYCVSELMISHDIQSFKLSDIDEEDIKIDFETFIHVEQCFKDAKEKIEKILEQRGQVEVDSVKVGDVLYFADEDDYAEIVRITCVEPQIQYEALPCSEFFSNHISRGTVGNDLVGFYRMPEDAFDKLKEVSDEQIRKCCGLVEAVYSE